MLLNFRDVALTAGPGLRPGLLLRSAQPESLTAADRRALAEIRMVIDLRGHAEQRVGDWSELNAAEVRIRHRPMPGSPSEIAALGPDGGLGAFYIRLLDRHGPWLAEVVTEIAHNLPVLVHCTAGKDRTGLVVALVLDLVGVAHEHIVRDYVATRPALPEINAMLLRRAADHGGAAKLRAAAARGFMDAPDTAIRVLLTELSRRGGAAAVLTTHGLDAAAVHLLRATLPAVPVRS